MQGSAANAFLRMNPENVSDDCKCRSLLAGHLSWRDNFQEVDREGQRGGRDGKGKEAKGRESKFLVTVLKEDIGVVLCKCHLVRY